MFVFDGRPGVIQVDDDRHTRHSRRFYTPDWTPLPHTNGFEMAPVRERPPELGTLLAIASA